MQSSIAGRNKLYGAMATWLVAVALGGATSPAEAQLGCGAILTAAGSPHVLNADIGPCDDDTGAALYIESDATVNLGNHRVFCEDTDGDGTYADGIVISGSNVALRNGSSFRVRGNALNAVNGCRHGVVVTGHLNSVSGVASRDNRYDGFHILGSGNTFDRNDATGNGKAIAACSHYSDEGSGFGDFGSGGNTYNYNVASGNACDGILVDSNGNTVSTSYANGNGRYGIYVEGGAQGNRIQYNNAWGNGDYDFSDENENCEGNVWFLNFGTYANQDCINVTLQ